MAYCEEQQMCNLTSMKGCFCEWKKPGSGIGEIDVDPETSTRTIERETGDPRSSVNRITRFHGLHPYHKTTVQNL